MGRLDLPDKVRDEDREDEDKFDDAGNPGSRQVLAPLDRGVTASTVSALPVSDRLGAGPPAFFCG